jgi:hypothetical protein
LPTGSDSDSPDIVERSQPLPLSNGRIQELPDIQNEDVTVAETVELDDMVNDLTWRSGQAIQNRKAHGNIRIHREAVRGTT